MKRILVVGANGSGKSTFAKELAKVSGLPITHLDQLFWQSGWKQRERADFDAKLQAICAKPEWVIDGNFPRTLEMRASYADTIILLDMPFFQCCWQLLKRQVQYFGKVRPDIAKDCPEKFDILLLKNLCQFFWSGRSKLKTIATDRPVQFHHLRSSKAKSLFLQNAY